jgi:hypothetical protein
MPYRKSKDCGRRNRNVPVITDSFVNRVSDGSVALMDRAISVVERESVGQKELSEDWFGRPFRVAEKLADRLALSEHCIQRRIGWAGYRGLSRELDLDF